MIEIVGHYTFGLSGTARPFLREGWSHREPAFTWTEGIRSRIVLPAAPGDGELLLEIAVNPLLLPPVVRRQQLVISVNGHAVGDETLLGECSLGMNVPRRALDGARTLDVQLDCPTAAVPAAVGMFADDRQLGVAVREILLFRTVPRAAYEPRVRPPLPQVAGGVEWRCEG